MCIRDRYYVIPVQSKVDLDAFIACGEVTSEEFRRTDCSAINGEGKCEVKVRVPRDWKEKYIQVEARLIDLESSEDISVKYKIVHLEGGATLTFSSPLPWGWLILSTLLCVLIIICFLARRSRRRKHALSQDISADKFVSLNTMN
eukprot:TRINITY_DN7183_c0_g3_i1.p1 TRINITY_DN7183_c0_g3~~TRINITY_DN7183_c0_g3_i1.p1  ORF type:complete len:165 (-),score=49.75 TRINITY_DN7183_c0_g3_i1:92-526(-)